MTKSLKPEIKQIGFYIEVKLDKKLEKFCFDHSLYKTYVINEAIKRYLESQRPL